jgi:RNA-binding protein
MLEITTKQRRELTARAHEINPIVIIGKVGLSTNVIQEIDQGLLSHELIKIRVMIGERETRETLLEQICQQLNAAPVKHIGKIFVLYRPKPDEDQKTSGSSTFKKKREPRRTKRSYQA